MKTLEITNTDDFLAIQMVADFGTLLGTYSRGFAVIIEPYDERLPHIPDPVLQLRWACSEDRQCNCSRNVVRAHTWSCQLLFGR
jgi:hypothetical protein